LNCPVNLSGTHSTGDRYGLQISIVWKDKANVTESYGYHLPQMVRSQLCEISTDDERAVQAEAIADQERLISQQIYCSSQQSKSEMFLKSNKASPRSSSCSMGNAAIWLSWRSLS